jgi:hypothetical protein
VTIHEAATNVEPYVRADGVRINGGLLVEAGRGKVEG